MTDNIAMPQPPAAVVYTPGDFQFRPRVARFIGTQLLAWAITILTFGIFYPYAVVLVERWKAKCSTIDGRRLEFTGLASGIFLKWIGWLLLTIITFGIYAFWWIPKMYQWKWENLRFVS
ncbi:DUF898 domain-containing protein [Demequina flava]|uniref:DUF898 domain-containing protein n=1 Tax=Demequina flava TaxID=1095025 RepID=UPI000B25759F|nr:DUF898 domain-containing protein [Demequina flava]